MGTKCPKCNTDNPTDSKYCKECATPLPSSREISVTETLETPTKELTRGTTFANRYEIIEELGKGGMGVVYKAEDTKLKRSVALKFMPQELASNPEAKERFVREAQAAAALDHPNICTVYEVDEAEGKTYISMAYVEGQSLKRRIEQKPLAVDEVLDIIIQVAEGLEEAHKKGIIHRDIKSANIMVDRKGQAKVMDFGLAKIRGGAQVTREGTRMGTVAYMSPEQARGKKVDHRTDIWSFGVVLYEMIYRQMPFEGENEASILYSIVHEEPKPVKDRKPGIPDEFTKIMNRALKKKPESRYQSVEDVLKDLRQWQSSLKAEEVGIKDLKSFLRLVRRPYVAIPTALVLLALCVFAVWSFRSSAKVRWARNEVIPEIMRLAEKKEYIEAFQLAREIENVIPDDPLLLNLWDQISSDYLIRTTPPEANVYVKNLNKIEKDWMYLGRTSEKNIQGPKFDSRGGCTPIIKLEKEGYETVEFAYEDRYVFTLDKKGSIPSKMVRVETKNHPLYKSFVNLHLYNYEALTSVEVEDFLIDKYEVTNKEFKEFIGNNGYSRPEFWKHKFIKDGQILSWKEAMRFFIDKTGRPGPSMWEFGTFPQGQEDLPVTGISWYEAAAYAEFFGKRLPTIYHWAKARSLFFEGNVIKNSNFGSKGLAPVGSHKKNLGAWGVYDMAGNAREWCINSVANENLRFILGAAWNDPKYFFNEPDVKPPFDRSPGNGFRCMKLIEAEADLEDLEHEIRRVAPPDWSQEKPLSDDEFNTWLGFLSYPETKLDTNIELADDNSSYWRMEKISFNAAYDNERMFVYLFLPKNSKPPYQTVIYWPGADAYWITDSKNGKGLSSVRWDFFVKDGRAVLFPVLKGTYERGGTPSIDLVKARDQVTRERGLIIKQIKDIWRSIDYLESRDDIDGEKIAYCGYSWGSHMGVFPCATDKRIKTGIFMSGRLWDSMKYGVSHYGWARRVKIPGLVLTGEYDTTFPNKQCQEPFFKALGTPEENKEQKVYPSSHRLASNWNEVIKDILAWLDKYLGAVEKK